MTISVWLSVSRKFMTASQRVKATRVPAVNARNGRFRRNATRPKSSTAASCRGPRGFPSERKPGGASGAGTRDGTSWEKADGSPTDDVANPEYRMTRYFTADGTSQLLRDETACVHERSPSNHNAFLR